MNLGKSYLGFTDNKKPMQKKLTENFLDKDVYYHGRYVVKKDLVFERLLGGWTLEAAWGDLTNSIYTGVGVRRSTEYRMHHPSRQYYNVISKTEYEFCQHLFFHDLVSEEHARRCMENEANRLHQEENERIEAEKLAEKAKQAASRARNRHKIWLENQVISYTNTQRLNLLQMVFAAMIPNCQPPYPTDLLVLIENIEHPLCREELIARLHTGNRASRKVFECITGLKMPKSNRASQEFLSTIKRDDFQESVAFKQRKLPTKTPSEAFYMLCNGAFKEVQAQPLQKYGMDLFVHKETCVTMISEARSGVLLVQGKNKKKAQKALKAMIETHSKQEVRNQIEMYIKKFGVSPRCREKVLNERLVA